MTNPKTSPPVVTDARIMTLTFPLDDDLPARRVVAYFTSPAK